MALRKLQSFKFVNETRIYRDSETAEYIVQLWEGGIHRPEATYYTDDKTDALQTAMVMAGFDEITFISRNTLDVAGMADFMRGNNHG